jgi:hypothetical protein
MKRALLTGIVVGTARAGCTNASQTDNGLVMACFEVVNQNLPGHPVVWNQIVTDVYFGGCSPADNMGMRSLEHATQLDLRAVP